MKKILLLAQFLFSTSFLQAQWTDNPQNNTPVCTAINDQDYCAATSDGAGGAIIAWQDDRSNGYKVYAQRMNADGVAQWGTDGKLIYSDDIYAVKPIIVSDGLGGAFIIWFEDNDYIYGQHVNASGTELWNVNGKKLASNYDCLYYNAIADGSGGFFLSYTKRNESYIYGQHFSVDGNPQWGASDPVICNAGIDANGDADNQDMLSDGSGGFFITWVNYISPSSYIYVQRYNAAGVAQWGVNGISVGTGYFTEYPKIVTDGGGGAIIGWNINNQTDSALYAQKINAAGITQWPTPTLITTTRNYSLKMISDNEGGAILGWNDGRFVTISEDTNYRAYTQHIDTQGVAQWAQNGISIKAGTNANPQGSPQPYINGDGYIYYTFLDVYNTSLSFDRIYGQKLNENGDLLWNSNGIPIGAHQFMHTFIDILPDSFGGMIVSFRDDREGLNGNIYVQNIHSDGTLGRYLGKDSFDVESFKLYPNPTNGKFTIDSSVIIDKIIIVDVLGQEILNVAPAASGTSIQLNNQAKGIYFVKLFSLGKQMVKKLSLE